MGAHGKIENDRPTGEIKRRNEEKFVHILNLVGFCLYLNTFFLSFPSRRQFILNLDCDQVRLRKLFLLDFQSIGSKRTTENY